MNTFNTKTRLASLALGVGALFLVPVGCSTAPNTVEGMNHLENRAQATLNRLSPSLPQPLDQYAGYAVFPDISRGAAGVGGAYGKGILYEHGTIIGYIDMTAGSLGWQLGGETFKEIIVFNDPNALHRLKDGNFEFNAHADVVASDSGAGVVARTLEGVTVYTLDKDGLMFSAAVGGQKFDFIPKT
jgi:lipid-binding SYLF domain-containing protein